MSSQNYHTVNTIILGVRVEYSSLQAASSGLATEASSRNLYPQYYTSPLHRIKSN